MAEQTVLIVEDEEDIRELLSLHLKQEGFTVLEAADGALALKLAEKRKPDLVLLDIMLPGQDGFTVCKALQRSAATADIPVLMLTARGEEMDRVVGLELGAADYVVKPFSLREVMLRVRAVLRRGRPAPESSILLCGAIRLDVAEHSVAVAGRPVELTITEFRLLEELLRNLGKARSREQLLNTVWGYSFDGYARTVDTHVRRLRGKLGPASENIETVRGIGYRAREAGV
ncbi:MAG: response regulator transcription factor [Desulfovibrio sp.]|jgi:two-component system phosphate regulon response regulator PhoB|nr:response regulator transcription factor [Desulfovibrio sp.]